MRDRVITRCVAARFGEAECECPKHSMTTAQLQAVYELHARLCDEAHDALNEGFVDGTYHGVPDACMPYLRELHAQRDRLKQALDARRETCCISGCGAESISSPGTLPACERHADEMPG